MSGARLSAMLWFLHPTHYAYVQCSSKQNICFLSPNCNSWILFLSRFIWWMFIWKSLEWLVRSNDELAISYPHANPFMLMYYEKKFYLFFLSKKKFLGFFFCNYYIQIWFRSIEKVQKARVQVLSRGHWHYDKLFDKNINYPKIKID